MCVHSGDASDAKFDASKGHGSGSDSIHENSWDVNVRMKECMSLLQPRSTSVYSISGWNRWTDGFCCVDQEVHEFQNLLVMNQNDFTTLEPTTFDRSVTASLEPNFGLAYGQDASCCISK